MNICLHSVWGTSEGITLTQNSDWDTNPANMCPWARAFPSLGLPVPAWDALGLLRQSIFNDVCREAGNGGKRAREVVSTCFWSSFLPNLCCLSKLAQAQSLPLHP